MDRKLAKHRGLVRGKCAHHLIENFLTREKKQPGTTKDVPRLDDELHKMERSLCMEGVQKIISGMILN